ncbi:MAG: hypothetical protein ACTH3E_03500 [Psychroflexus halocasei]
MKKSFILFIGILYALISCDIKDPKLENPLMDFELNESNASWNNKLNRHQGKELGILDDNFYDRYEYYFKKGDDSIFSILKINIDGYDFGNLRSMKFHIITDSTYNSTRTVDTSTVNKIENWLIDYYGVPDDTLRPGEYDSEKLIDMVRELNDKDPNKYGYDFYDIGFDVGYRWNKENFELTFNKGSRPSIGYNKKLEGQYKNTHITYTVKEYDKVMKKIADSVRLTLEPNDLVNFKTPYKPVLEKLRYDRHDYKISFKTRSIYRTGREELRGVKKILTDFVVIDEFENESLRLSDYSFDLSDSPIEISGWTKDRGYEVTAKFNITNTAEGRKQKKFIRMYNEDRSRFKIKADIKAVVFEDDEVLKK